MHNYTQLEKEDELVKPNDKALVAKAEKEFNGNT